MLRIFGVLKSKTAPYFPLTFTPRYVSISFYLPLIVSILSLLFSLFLYLNNMHDVSVIHMLTFYTKSKQCPKCIPTCLGAGSGG